LKEIAASHGERLKYRGRTLAARWGSISFSISFSVPPLCSLCLSG